MVVDDSTGDRKDAGGRRANCCVRCGKGRRMSLRTPARQTAVLTRNNAGPCAVASGRLSERASRQPTRRGWKLRTLQAVFRTTSSWPNPPIAWGWTVTSRWWKLAKRKKGCAWAPSPSKACTARMSDKLAGFLSHPPPASYFLSEARPQTKASHGIYFRATPSP